MVEVASASLQSPEVSTVSQSPSVATVVEVASASSQSSATRTPSPSWSSSAPSQSWSTPSYQVSARPGFWPAPPVFGSSLQSVASRTYPLGVEQERVEVVASP